MLCVRQVTQLELNKHKQRWILYVHTRTHTHTVKRLMSFGVSSDAPEAKSNTAHWEKWFQTLVITALITYSARSFSPFLPSFSLSLPPFPPFRSVSSWLQFMARRLSLCHPPYGFLSLFLAVWSNGNGVFLLDLSFHFFFIRSPHLFLSCSLFLPLLRPCSPPVTPY